MGTVSEDVSLLFLADEDRNVLICKQRSVGTCLLGGIQYKKNVVT